MSKGNPDAADTRALYRKYRSKSLDEVVGQSHITDILSRALAQGRVAHAYLFTGPRGVGKTSVARILAHEINQIPYDESTQHPDIIEIDAASNRRIDDIRDLRDKVQIAPAAAKYKVYIIDEVHMLTGESFNAFLKTLEEPPAHVVFILATTDAHRLPGTITSRTQRFTFRAIAPKAAHEHLRMIADTEKINIDDKALELIALHGDGSFRDSISLLDQLSSVASAKTPVTAEVVEQILGLAPGQHIAMLISAYEAADQQSIISTLNELEHHGVASSVTTDQLIRTVKQALVSAPHLSHLLLGLIDVRTSPRPDIALLTALLPSSPPPSAQPRKVVAATASAPQELRSLEKEASKPRPSEKRIRQEAKKQPVPPPNPEEEAPPEATLKPHAPSDPSPSVTEPFDWDGYVTHMRENHIALGTILAKCKAENDGATLTIYTGTAFWKKKLDDVRYQPLLHEGLRAVGVSELSILTLPTSMPPKDSQAAAAFAIMGGGEEVSLEDA